MIQETLSEPNCDLQAQLVAISKGYKKAMFLSPGNSLDHLELPVNKTLYKHVRKEGTVISDDPEIVTFFEKLNDITEDDMAIILGYPESKDDLRGKAVIIVQFRDENDNVTTEYASSWNNVYSSLNQIRDRVPEDGYVAFIKLENAIKRRVRRD